MRCSAYIMVFACTLWAQGTAPRPDPDSYRVQVSGTAADYGIEYQVRTVSAGRDSFLTEDYLVIEVAVFPNEGRDVKVDLRSFSLRLNGKSSGLLAQTPGIVAASLNYPDWERRAELTLEAGAGDRGVLIGRRPVTERFPGDPRPAQGRLPRIPAEGAGQPSDAPEEERAAPSAILQSLSLPEGVTNDPVSGYIFFPYRGRLGAIKQVTLLIAEEDREEPLAARLR